jgi:hypothetical protein
VNLVSTHEHPTEPRGRKGGMEPTLKGKGVRRRQRPSGKSQAALVRDLTTRDREIGEQVRREVNRAGGVGELPRQREEKNREGKRKRGERSSKREDREGESIRSQERGRRVLSP